MSAESTDRRIGATVLGNMDYLRIWTWASILASATSQTGRPRHGVTQGVRPELGRGRGV